jgi:hypothetical protein
LRSWGGDALDMVERGQAALEGWPLDQWPLHGRQ